MSTNQPPRSITRPDLSTNQAVAAHVSAEQARRFLVLRQLLAPPRSLPPEPESVLKVIDRLGLLQFDPIDVPGARSHEIVLVARIAGYRRGWCEQWLYGEDRRLVELYNKSLNILPIEELPLHRVTWAIYARREDTGILREQAELVTTILGRIETEGPLSTDAFPDTKHVVEWWWAPTRAARAVMEALFVSGRLGISRRDGNRRYYDLIERLISPQRLSERAPEEAGRRHRLLSLFRATGMTGPSQSGLGDAMTRVGTAAERVRWTAELVDEGVLKPVAVEGLRGVRYMLAKEAGILEAAAHSSDEPAGVSFIAPLDPMVWDRRLLRELWGFDYLWEIYTPAQKRKWGYYVLPVLYGDRFVGRIEPRYERKTRTLNVIGMSFDDGVKAFEDQRFLPALAECMEAYRTFVGATRMAWPRTRAAREVATAVRNLG